MKPEKFSLAAAAVLSVFFAVDSGVGAAAALFTPAAVEGVGVARGNAIAGYPVFVDWDIDKRTECGGVSSRVWSGPDGFFLSETVQATALPMGRNQITVPTDVPRLAPVGTLELNIVGSFQCETGGPIHFKLGPVFIEVVG